MIDNQKSSSGTVYFAKLCRGSYFMAIGNEDAVEVTPVRQFEDGIQYQSRIVVQRGSGNITRKNVITDQGVMVIHPRSTDYNRLSTGIPERTGPRAAQEDEAPPEPKANI